jgi:hypothetical protein
MKKIRNEKVGRPKPWPGPSSDNKYDFSHEAELTTRELADEISKIGSLSEDKIAALLPKRADQEELQKLIDAVNQATTENERKAAIIKSLGTLSKVVTDVVVKYAPKLIDLAT